MKNLLETISNISEGTALVGITTSAISIVPLVHNKISFYTGLGIAGAGIIGLFTTNMIRTAKLLRGYTKKDLVNEELNKDDGY